MRCPRAAASPGLHHLRKPPPTNTNTEHPLLRDRRAIFAPSHLPAAEPGRSPTAPSHREASEPPPPPPPPPPRKPRGGRRGPWLRPRRGLLPAGLEAFLTGLQQMSASVSGSSTSVHSLVRKAGTLLPPPPPPATAPGGSMLAAAAQPGPVFLGRAGPATGSAAAAGAGGAETTSGRGCSGLAKARRRAAHSLPQKERAWPPPSFDAQAQRRTHARAVWTHCCASRRGGCLL